MNVFSSVHDEYLLKLFSILKRSKWGDDIKLEQDIKKEQGGKKRILRIPDFIVCEGPGKYFFEYERSLKSDEKYDRINTAYMLEDEDVSYFVFICESEKIAKKVLESVRLKYLAIIKKDAFLHAMVTEKKERLLDYIKDREVSYFFKR